jgi:hypothetical protein
MRNITKLFFISAMALMTVTSCKKEDNNNNNTPANTNSGIASCEVNGKSWTSGKTGSYLGTDSLPGCEALLVGDTMTFIATNFTDSSVVLAQLVLKPARTGSYTGTTSTEGAMLYLPKLDQNSIFQAFLMYTTTYSMNITQWNEGTKTLSGTFNLNMVSNIGGAGYNITNGKFTDVKFSLD